jgi:hypothetical protein
LARGRSWVACRAWLRRHPTRERTGYTSRGVGDTGRGLCRLPCLAADARRPPSRR